ncbi:MAG: hypothetical protein KJO36_09155, partial [Acidimicrobiia bacterium]|nr:hypothetical protein [Acidimicrobiia bacterium]
MPKRTLLVFRHGSADIRCSRPSRFRKWRRTTRWQYDLRDVADAGRIDVPPEFEPEESGHLSKEPSTAVGAVVRYLSPVLLAVMLWGCGASESDPISTPDPTSGPTTSTPTTTTPTTTVVTTTAPATTTTEAQPTTVVFTGETCSVEGNTSIEAGLITVAVDNRSPNPAEAIIGRIDDGLDRATIEADVAAGL